MAPLALPAAAEEDQWSFGFTSYIWGSWVDGTLDSGGRELPVSVTFEETLKDLSFAFQGAGEVRYGRFGALVDVTYANLTSRVDTPFGVLFSEAVTDTEQWIVNAIVTYRFYQDRAGWIDAAAGARVISLETDTTLKAGLLPAEESSAGDTIVSPIVGMRGHVAIGDGFGVTGAFDVGGFGVGSDFTWQLLGTLDYEISEGIALRVGYRHIGVSTSNDVDMDLNWTGPVVGIGFRF